jgi:photosystem II stability/assembly factor-like uncharacterized protein
MPTVVLVSRPPDRGGAIVRLRDRLAQHFGQRHVKVLWEAIAPAAAGDMPQRMRRMVRHSDVALVVVGADGVSAPDATGRYPLDYPADPVRLALEVILDMGTPLIPLLLEGALVPDVSELPASLGLLPALNGIEVDTDSNFALHAARVIQAVEQYAKASRRARRQARRLRGWRRELRRLVGAGVDIAAVLMAATAFFLVAVLLSTGLLVQPPPAVAPPGHQVASSRLALTSVRAGWAVGAKGRIWQLTWPAGAPQPQWRQVASPVVEDLRSVAMSSADDGWAVGNRGVLLHYTVPVGPAGGGQWTRVAGPTTLDLNGIAMVSASEGWAVGAAGTILHDTNGRWTPVNSPARCDLHALALAVTVSGQVQGWAVGVHSCLLRLDFGSWRLATVAFSRDLDLTAVAFTSAGDGWAVGTGGALVHYSAAAPVGSEWVDVVPLTTANLQGIALDAQGMGWAVGDGGTVLRFANQQWSPVRQTATTTTLASIDLLSSNEAWAYGTDGTFLHEVAGDWTRYAG